MDDEAIHTVAKQRADLLDAGVPTVVLIALVLVAWTAWVMSHRYKEKVPGAGGRFFYGLVRAVIGAISLWSLWQLGARFLVFASAWPLWVNAFIGGGAIEAAIAAYGFERATLVKWRSRTLLGLRLAAIGLVLFILVQPVFSRLEERKVDREVVVLIDDSESMQLVDRQLPVSEKLALASYYGVAGIEGRIDLGKEIEGLQGVVRGLQRQQGALAMATGGAALPEAVRDGAVEAIGMAGQTVEGHLSMIESVRGSDQAAGEAGKVIDESVKALRERVVEGLRRTAGLVVEGKIAEAQTGLKEAASALQSVGEKLPDAVEAIDEKTYEGLGSDVRSAVDEACDRSRAAIARDVLMRDGEGGSLSAQLEARYKVRYVRFGRKAAEISSEQYLDSGIDSGAIDLGDEAAGDGVLDREGGSNKDDDNFSLDEASGGEASADDRAEGTADGGEMIDDLEFRGLTDIAGALSHAAEKIAPETLAGILLTSDGQHNARGQVEDIARRLGVQGAPVGAVAIGSSAGPPDASILDLQVSDSVYLGDKIVARADVKLDGLRGKSVRAVLVRDGEDLDELEIKVPSDRYRTNLRFKHVPDDKGIYSYSVRLDPVEGELFRDNNDWHFDVAVTDDRKNVLLVDSFARWEFRYLRNLFYARDKSVHLQYVVLHPEVIEGQAPLAEVAASASRPFGEAEATRLPESREEWLKFDAIILGDVPPAVFGEKEWEIVDECVRERGAMLVVVAGPRYMPHAFSDVRFKELLPVIYGESSDEQFAPPEMGYRLALTPEGRNSQIMKQAPSGLVNAQIWGGMPDLRWRHTVDGVKEGAEVLAFAEIEGARVRGPGEGFAGLFEERQAQRKAALIATQRYAMGSVCALMFDRTWRFRYGVGDVYHHRFWGQLMRWGTGENLRVGTEFVRMGSDRLSYQPGERVRVVARVSTPDYRPVVDDDVRVAVYRGDERIAGTRLSYRAGSNGIYEVELEPFAEPGRYRLVLEGDEAGDILEADGVDELSTDFLVESAKNAIELSELTVDRDFLNKTAALSDGRVVGVGAAATLIDLFGEPSKVVEERLETTLWDTWPVLLLFVGVVTAEWIVRRRGGLV